MTSPPSTTTTSVPALDLELLRQTVRAAFPTLPPRDPVFLENAGGSQVPASVADAVRDYMLECYVQLGAGYRRIARPPPWTAPIASPTAS